MKIAIIGSGYVGLVSGVCLAQIGHQVICVDNNPDKINTLKLEGYTLKEEAICKLLDISPDMIDYYEKPISPEAENAKDNFAINNKGLDINYAKLNSGTRK